MSASPAGRDLSGHDVRSVSQMGWAGQQNGALLALAQHEFDVFLTVDRNLSFQQDANRFDLAVIVMIAPSNRIQDLRPLVPQVLDACRDARPGRIVRVDS